MRVFNMIGEEKVAELLATKKELEEIELQEQEDLKEAVRKSVKKANLWLKRNGGK